MTILPPTSSNSSTTTNHTQTTAVQVALRVRPLTQQDRAQPRFSNSTDSDVIKTYENSVVIVPHQKSFQFDHVFDASSTQEQVFSAVGSKLVDRFIDGYNVTILAYGQTSSGKTYTMGTAIDSQIGSNSEQEGIIPRAMSALFKRLNDIKHESMSKSTSSTTEIKRTPSLVTSTAPSSGLRIPKRTSTLNLRPVSMSPRRGSNTSIKTLSQDDKSTRYTVHVSFIEIYNEELVDLLNPAQPQERTPVTIREDTKGHIIWTGLREVPVENTEDVLRHLQIGTENRATGSTDMNAKSSRSHAIFSVTLKQEKWVPTQKAPAATRTINRRPSTLNVKAMIGQMEKRGTGPEEESGEWMVTHSKFHFVDLAGSERLKRTAAQGDRRKEGININAGLLALGNVISALSDPHHKRSTHVPYRDSKLTRLLQDSLGGNSTTMMIACVSPAEINLTETSNTIKYAYRARNIRNKTEKNETKEWMTNDNVDHLRHIITKLKAEIKSLKSSQHSTPSPKSDRFNRASHELMSLSSSSTSGSDIHLSTYPSTSATTHNTMPDSSISTELCSDGHQSNDAAVLVSDLRRQIEELQNELIVTRERNLHVENELLQQSGGENKPQTNNEFQHLVEPVIEEYEKSISGLESQLAMARAALNHSDQALTEQQTKIAEYESMQINEIQVLNELKARLSAALEREHSSEAYCLQLEAQLEKSVRDGHKDQQILSELREKIIKFKEMDTQTEKYITDLESQLSTSEAERERLSEKIAALTAKSTEKSQNNSNEEKNLLEKELASCQTKCQELEKELDSFRERIRLEQAAQSEKLSKIAELSNLLSQKDAQVQVLNSKLGEIEQLKTELSNLRQNHLEETNRLEEAIRKLKETHQVEIFQERRCSQGKIDELTLIKQTLEHKMKEQEKNAQKLRHEEIEKLKSDLGALQMIEEKQDVIIQGLETKLEEMSRLLNSAHTQLDERDQTIRLLEAENTSKAEIVAHMKKQLKNVLRDVCTIGTEKKNLERVMQVMENTLRAQEVKSEKAMEALKDIKHQYKANEQEIEEKRRTVDLLSAEKEELSDFLKQASERVSQDDEKVKSLTVQLNEARRSLNEQSTLVEQLKQDHPHTDLGSHHLQELETKVQVLEHELDVEQKNKKEKEEVLSHLQRQMQQQLIQNEELTQIVSELQHQIQHERALASAKDSTGMIVELETKLSILQEAKKKDDKIWKHQVEKIKEELYLSHKENNQYKTMVETLEESLDQIKKQMIKEKSSSTLSITYSPYHSRSSLFQDGKKNEEDVEKVLDLKQVSCESFGQQEMLDKIMQLQEDNAQLLKHNDDLESQLILQRGQLTLETKNLELELMKLTAANDRLEKEMEQIISKSNNNLIGHNRESIHFTSPPQTPRVSSPPPAHPSANQSTGSTIQYMLQRDISNSSISRTSKSGSYRSVSAMLLESNGSATADEVKRLSTLSAKSDATVNPRASIRNSRPLSNLGALPPPSAPPSNPLPPIPTPLPPPPSSPCSIGGLSAHESESGSPPMRPMSVGSPSQSSLQRQDSNASTTFSEIMTTNSASGFTAEKYDRLIRSLQRKAQFAENDVRSHQEVISKLEAQLIKSESSVCEVKRQLDQLSREKQAYNLEIQNLRTQVTQIQSQQRTLTDESLTERKELEEKLEQQKQLKEKAEKARRILENRMDELMNKKSKFMCF